MKIFIGGSKSIEYVDNVIKQELLSLVEMGCTILIGDCRGIDTAIQQILAEICYSNVEVYASNGIARNNIGNWKVHNVPVADNIKGFKFYRQKDIAMANESDQGLMIWDEKSKGTLSNLLDLVNQNKESTIYLLAKGERRIIRNYNELSALVSELADSARILFDNMH